MPHREETLMPFINTSTGAAFVAFLPVTARQCWCLMLWQAGKRHSRAPQGLPTVAAGIQVRGGVCFGDAPANQPQFLTEHFARTRLAHTQIDEENTPMFFRLTRATPAFA
ncbi:MAG: hypothetical protein IPP88_15530 [Betaproteobacteria bacterium]|nr:hypothetical protein [Betaproteobacteria bacterium]